MVLIGTVEIGGLGLSLSKLGLAECAALGEEVAPAQRQECMLLEQADKVAGRLLQGVLESQIIHGLYTNGAEIGGLTGEVLGHTDDEVVQVVAILQVGLMLCGSHPVIGGDIRYLAALRIDPDLAGADLDGVNGAILGDLIAFGHTGLHDALCIISKEVVEGGPDNAGIGVGGCSKDIPGSGVIHEGRGVGILESVTLLGEILHGLLDVGAGAHELISQITEVILILTENDLVGDDHLRHIAHIAAPGSVTAGAVYDTAHLIACNAAIHGGGNAALQYLSFCYCQQRIALGNAGSFGSLLIIGVELAQVGHIDILVVVINGKGLLFLGGGVGSGGLIRGGGSVGSGCGGLVVFAGSVGRSVFCALGASCSSENHHHCQQQRHDSLGPSYLHVCVPFFFLYFSPPGMAPR